MNRNKRKRNNKNKNKLNLNFKEIKYSDLFMDKGDLNKNAHQRISKYYLDQYTNECNSRNEEPELLITSILTHFYNSKYNRKIMEFVKQFYYNNFCYVLGDMNDALLYFYKIQRKYSYLCKFAFICKYKMKKNKIQNDLCLKPLTEIKDKYKITLIDDNNKYIFTIHDLINLINSNLCNMEGNMEGMFPEPKVIKNPYTNLDFEVNNLYNIYFFIKNSNIRIPHLFELFFVCDFNLNKFSYIYDYDIREKGIHNYCNNLSNSRFRQIVDELLKKHKDIIKIKIDEEFPINHLKDVMQNNVHLYISHKMTLIQSKKHYYHKLLRKRLSYFNELNPTYGRKKIKIVKKSPFSKNFKTEKAWETNYKNINILDKNINSAIYKKLYEDLLENEKGFVDSNNINIDLPSVVRRRRRRSREITEEDITRNVRNIRPILTSNPPILTPIFTSNPSPDFGDSDIHTLPSALNYNILRTLSGMSGMSYENNMHRTTGIPFDMNLSGETGFTIDTSANSITVSGMDTSTNSVTVTEMDTSTNSVTVTGMDTSTNSVTVTDDNMDVYNTDVYNTDVVTNDELITLLQQPIGRIYPEQNTMNSESDTDTDTDTDSDNNSMPSLIMAPNQNNDSDTDNDSIISFSDTDNDIHSDSDSESISALIENMENMVINEQNEDDDDDDMAS